MHGEVTQLLRSAVKSSADALSRAWAAHAAAGEASRLPLLCDARGDSSEVRQSDGTSPSLSPSLAGGVAGQAGGCGAAGRFEEARMTVAQVAVLAAVSPAHVRSEVPKP